MQLREECLWERLYPAMPGAPLRGDIDVEVCVIGAGFTGLSTGLHLAQAGRRVAVLEAHGVGHGGSGRNVGLVNAGMWIPPDEAVATLGQEVGERLLAVMGDAPSQVFALVERYGIDCQPRRAGTLHMAHSAKGLADLGRRAEQWQRRGARVELLEGEACYTACGTRDISGALLDHRAGTLVPMGYAQGLAKALRQEGGELFEQTTVRQLQRVGERWLVETEQGRVSADQVVIASNAYTEGEWTTLRKQFFAGYYYQVASQPLGPEADFILPQGRGSWDTRTVLSSIRRDAEGRLLLGSLGNMAGRPASFIRAWADRIQRHYFPSLGRVDWECTWTGRIAFTPDHLMRLFEPAPGLLAVTGYNGRGVTTGTVVGQAFARYLCSGDRNDLPMPLASLDSNPVGQWRSLMYEAGFTLYHAGQCLRVVL
ncbi:FAD-binding oxidoreductase [uncultured Pseudomonas sp.]|uniref:L-pipecolate oxidase n=1 Tax=uncultured Pseudomonas sp. TaxID=114707 RepID=UPI0025FDC608|nr:FAD-binding oxidoreductase [uncultured Pseudomonas sp.]